MSFTPTIPVAVPIVVSLNQILNPSLLVFPFTSIAVENRYFTLYEIKGREEESLGALINGMKMGTDTEVFELNKQYDLYLINLTEDPHPMHTHLVNFQHYKRAPFNWKKYLNDWKQVNGGEPPYMKAVTILRPDIYLTSTWRMLDGVHRVWKDVANVEARTVSVFRMRLRYNNGNSYPFDIRQGHFVLHCHIIEHEDNEMMRYFTVV